MHLRRAYEHTGCAAGVEALNRCLFVFEMLDLSSPESSHFRDRLHNAQRYSKLAEWGAARFELCLLLQSLAPGI